MCAIQYVFLIALVKMMVFQKLIVLRQILQITVSSIQNATCTEEGGVVNTWKRQEELGRLFSQLEGIQLKDKTHFQVYPAGSYTATARDDGEGCEKSIAFVIGAEENSNNNQRTTENTGCGTNSGSVEVQADRWGRKLRISN